jgi:hypothetical protein
MDNLDELRDDVAACQAAIDQAVAHFNKHRWMFPRWKANRIVSNLNERQHRLDIAKKYLDAMKK